MSAINLEIAESDLAILQDFAKRDQVSPEVYLQRLIVESLKEMREYQYWRERGKQGNLDRFREILAKAPDVPPIPGDELPEGWSEKESNKH
jgi:hypothetical protein